ncbi:MAG: type II toxin-antitoxin system HipA family toxin [Alphaproteobacteria bacterium]|nr:type II toxin-antitoxin system HipA family toxin [Alphaproteobacteria bacterium]
MIRVWSDGLSAGLLDRHGPRGAVFAYDHGAAPARGVSMTMPVRLASWNHAWGIHPIFEMNLPEGALRERLRLSFAKATGTFDAFDLLAVVGRSQIGRLRHTSADATLDEEVPFQSVDEILTHRRDGDLFAAMPRRFAVHSGLSGVQPKLMVRDEADAGISVRGATHIVKFWSADEYPELATNEFFCLRAAERCGLEVPRFRLAEDGSALVVDRFDLRPDGTYRGVEDFCVLNARGTDEKYRGDYETALFGRMRAFIDGEHLPQAMDRLFTLFVLNRGLRNGDAHLKNFALVYDDVTGSPRLAPVYDLVTTTAYIPEDGMALTLGGSTRWPDTRKLAALGTTRCGLTPRRVREIFDIVATAIAETAAEMRTHIADHPEFAEIGRRMLDQWDPAATGSINLFR